MEQAYLALSQAAAGIVQLVPGGELDLEELRRPVDELRRFALAGNPRYLLVETPYLGWPLDIGERFFGLRASGITPVLAHPERNADVQQRPELLEPLVATGTLVQVTAGSVDGRLGRRPRDCAAALLARELVHLIASDGHSPSVRAIGMRAAAEAVGDDDLAYWLTTEVPRAIVDDAKLPPRPETVKRKRFRFF
jgi:protein-tyrosine phosphatase